MKCIVFRSGHLPSWTVEEKLGDPLRVDLRVGRVGALLCDMGLCQSLSVKLNVILNVYLLLYS